MKARIILTMFLVFVMAFAVVSPVMAAPIEAPLAVEEDEGIFDWASIGDSLQNIGIFILVTIGVVLGTERGTEIGKLISRWAAKTKFTKWMYINGTGSTALAVLVAFVGVYQFDVQLLERFDLLKEAVDPELLRIISGLLVWLGSGAVHEELPAVFQSAKRVGRYVAKPKAA